MKWEEHSRQYEIYGNIVVLYNGEKQRNCFVLSSSTFAQSDVVCWWSSFSKKSARIGHVVGWRSRQLPCTNRVFLFPHFFKVDCFPPSSVTSIHFHHFNRNRLAGQLSRQSSLVANFPRGFFSSVMGSPPLRECSNCFRVSPRWCRKIAAMSSIYTVLCQILYLCKLRI